ncbi:hypothetical protein RchiOBHm_Chr7g0189751 [Rosa chinensis]|uniref:Uncharacterized protein n=1 Tax=Rosa chinensis TaxID=74649 RepID=A0A2P6P4U3_ROSCH|nr:hypothetical protein RchiOBHm_Chr7g0189751 [Rosa chinensis]
MTWALFFGPALLFPFHLVWAGMCFWCQDTLKTVVPSSDRVGLGKFYYFLLFLSAVRLGFSFVG